MLLNLIASTAVFASVVLAVHLAFNRSAYSAEARVRALTYGERARWKVEGSFGERMVTPRLEALARALNSILPAGIRAQTEERLAMAGRPMSSAAFFGLSLLMGMMLPLAALGVAFLILDTPSALVLIPVTAFLALL